MERKSKYDTKVLYIDYLSPGGHKNFNNIYLDRLQKLDVKIDVVIEKGYSINIDSSNCRVINIPSILFLNINNGLINRVFYILRLLYIKNRLNLNDYRYIILASFEEISLSLASIKQRMYLINHNNLNGLDNKLKLHFYKSLSNRYTHIVFDYEMKNRLFFLGIADVIVMPHGLPKQYNISEKQNDDTHELLLETSKYKHVFFSPSPSSIDKNLISQIIYNKKFREFLKENECLLLLKDFGQSFPKMEYILCFKSYIPQSVYEKIFLNSSVILLCYSNQFKYRVSGILYEAISNNKKVLTSNRYLYNTHKRFFNYSSYFINPSMLIDCLKESISRNESSIPNSYYKNQKSLTPKFEKLFDN